MKTLRKATVESEDVSLISKKERSRRAAKKIILEAPIAAHKADCENLSKMELRRRYSAEASSHRNMLSRQKSHGAVVHPAFREFVSFLRIVGPIPAKGATLDRIDNSDPEYGPNKVRWADRRTQNSNKSDTLIFHYSRTGDAYTTSRLAKLRKVSPSTIRKRRERGWSDDEVIEGKRKTRGEHLLPPRSKLAKQQPYGSSYPTSAKEIAFLRMQRDCEEHRRIYGGEENFPAPLDVLNEGAERLGIVVTAEQYERKIAQWWPQYRPHVIYERLPQSQQDLIARIDPDYVAKRAEKAMTTKLLADTL